MPTNFLWQSGTSNDGLLASALSLQTTELNSLTTGSYAVSSVGGASGVFTNSDTAQAIYGRMFLTLGAVASALSAGANIAGWFLHSYDGTNFGGSSGVVPLAPRISSFHFPPQRLLLDGFMRPLVWLSYRRLNLRWACKITPGKPSHRLETSSALHRLRNNTNAAFSSFLSFRVSCGACAGL